MLSEPTDRHRDLLTGIADQLAAQMPNPEGRYARSGARTATSAWLVYVVIRGAGHSPVGAPWSAS
jgi:hypothetical protein